MKSWSCAPLLESSGAKRVALPGNGYPEESNGARTTNDQAAAAPASAFRVDGRHLADRRVRDRLGIFEHVAVPVGELLGMADHRRAGAGADRRGSPRRRLSYRKRGADPLAALRPARDCRGGL